MQELVDIMACQQITDEDDTMEYLEDGASSQSGKDPQPHTDNVLDPDHELHSTVKNPEHVSLCATELKPHALDIEGPTLGQ